jgi:hypothetical protein
LSRTLSAPFIAAINAQETGEVVICLLTIVHTALATPIYLSSDPTTRVSDIPLVYSTTSRGNEYLFLPFEFTLPDDTSDSPPRVQLTIDSVDRSLISLLRSVSTPADVTVEIVLASSLNHVELQLPALQLANVTIGEVHIAIDLVSDPLINEPVPADLFTPGSFPGVF